MKRKLLILLLLGLSAALCACSMQAEQEPVYHTVSFCDGNSLLAEIEVLEGESPDEVPQTGTFWLDESGRRAYPAKTAVMADRTFYTARSANLSAAHPLLLSADGARFAPDDTVTRAEAAELVCKLLVPEILPDGEEVPYTDVDDGRAYYSAVQTVSALSLMGGYPDGTFRPDTPITRAEFAALLYELAEEETDAAPSFPDVPTEHWAAAAVACCEGHGWLQGYDDGCFYPEAPLTRACAAAAVATLRGMDILPEDYDTACGGESPFSDVPTDHWAYYAILDAAYTNELIDYAYGRAADMEPGMVLVGDHLCHVNAETLRLDRYEEGFQTIDGGLYYVPQDGWLIARFDKGVTEFQRSMYYVTADDGPFLTNGYYGYLYFGQDGRYTSGSTTVDEYAESLLSDILWNDSLSQYDKLYRAYCCIRDGGYRYRPKDGWIRGSTDWTIQSAVDMYETKSGGCFYWAASLLYLVRRLGIQSYAVSGGVGTRNQLHAWVMVQWYDGEEYICDVELEWAYIHNFYDVSYSTTNMFMQSLSSPHAAYWFPDGRVVGYYGSAAEVIEEDNDTEPIVVPDDYYENEPGDEPGDEPGGDEPGGDDPGGDEPGGDEPGGDEPGGDDPGGDDPGGDDPGGDQPGNDQPGNDQPGNDQPGGDEPGGDADTPDTGL